MKQANIIDTAIDTARLITTLKCNRSCHYCCNTPEMIDSATKIPDLSSLAEFDTVCVTGGEPMLQPERTLQIIRELRKQRPNRKIYLYTAFATIDILVSLMYGGLDGVHYTLHYDAGDDEIDRMQVLQGTAELCYVKPGVNKTFRLYIDPNIERQVTITPRVWSRVEVKPWLDDCPLPSHEKLFVLDEAYLSTDPGQDPELGEER